MYDPVDDDCDCSGIDPIHISYEHRTCYIVPTPSLGIGFEEEEDGCPQPIFTLETDDFEANFIDITSIQV